MIPLRFCLLLHCKQESLLAQVLQMKSWANKQAPEQGKWTIAFFLFRFWGSALQVCKVDHRDWHGWSQIRLATSFPLFQGKVSIVEFEYRFMKWQGSFLKVHWPPMVEINWNFFFCWLKQKKQPTCPSLLLLAGAISNSCTIWSRPLKNQRHKCYKQERLSSPLTWLLTK